MSEELESNDEIGEVNTMGVSKRHADPTAGRTSRHVPPPVLAAGALGAQVLLSEKHERTKRAKAAGTLVAAGSLLLMGGAVIEFQPYHTTVNPKTMDTTTLVIEGPNRFTRNPMYLGLAGLLTAHALWRRSWSALIPVAAFALVIDRTQIPAEETVLQQRFGAAYERYRATTPRWIGLPRRN